MFVARLGLFLALVLSPTAGATGHSEQEATIRQILVVGDFANQCSHALEARDLAAARAALDTMSKHLGDLLTAQLTGARTSIEYEEGIQRNLIRWLAGRRFNYTRGTFEVFEKHPWGAQHYVSFREEDGRLFFTHELVALFGRGQILESFTHPVTIVSAEFDTLFHMGSLLGTVTRNDELVFQEPSAPETVQRYKLKSSSRQNRQNRGDSGDGD